MPKSTLQGEEVRTGPGSVYGKVKMAGPLNPKSGRPGATRRTAVGLILGAPLLGACSGVQQSLSSFSNPFGSSEPGPAGAPQQPLAVGSGQRSEEHTSELQSRE